jgi:hypothetical protein
LPVILIPTVLSGYAVLVWYGYVGIPAAGERVELTVRTCAEGRAVVRARIEDMGLGDPEYTATPDGFTAVVTLPDNDFADAIPVSLAKEGQFEILSNGEVFINNAGVESSTLRLDFTGEPSIAIQLTEEASKTLEDTMRADPEGMVQLQVDGVPMGDRVNTPTETRGHITLPITGVDRPSQVATAAEFGLVMSRPLPCRATVDVNPAPVTASQEQP